MKGFRFFERNLGGDGHRSGLMLKGLFAGLVVFTLWAAVFKIDQTVSAPGQVIPSARTQLIQTVDGGVLSGLMVHEGQAVKAGQLLAVLEKDRVNASYEESRSNQASLQAELIRVQAEIEGRPPVFGEQFRDYPEFVIAQQRWYRQRLQGLRDELDYLQANLAMATEELETNRGLAVSGDVSRLEVMRSEREVNSVKGKISEARNRYQKEAREELTKVEAQLASARYKFDERSNVLEHTELRAPVAGIVKYLRVNTLGGVLRAGDELMQISPTGSDMVIEVRVNPADVGLLRLGLPVSIKLDAFDYYIYGQLEGVLIYLSSDTMTENMEGGRSVSYYRARVRVDEKSKKANPKFAQVELRPGMTSSVDIRTGSRSVLNYLLKPVMGAFSGAMNQR